MTISTTESRKSYTGNGSTASFSFPYKFLADGDLKVYVDNVLKTLTTDYTLSGAGDASGGTVTFVTAPASLTSVVFYRDMAITQEVDYITGDAFPAETHEEALDRLTMIDQQQEDQIDRAVKLQLGDETSSMELPLKATRATKMLGFDADGDVAVSGSTMTDIESAVLVTKTVTAGGAVTDAANIIYDQGGTGSVSRTVENKLQESVSVKDFGAAGDGVTNDTAAFVAAFANMTANTSLYIPAGHYILDSDGSGWGGNYITIPVSNVSIYGAGDSSTKIELTGTTGKGFLYSENQNHISIEGIHFKGNNVGNSFNKESTAIWINYSDATGTSDDGHISVTNCSFEEFEGPYWVAIYNYRTALTYPVTDIKFTELSFWGGSDYAPSDLGVAARQLGVHCTSGGIVEYVTISNCYLDAYNVKGGIGFQGNTNKISIDSCHVERSGQKDGAANPDKARYAIMVYNSSEEVSITNCVIDAPYDAGLYLLDVDRGVVSGNVFTGQTGTANATLAKGAVAVAQADVVVDGNTFYNNAIGIDYRPASEITQAQISNNKFRESKVIIFSPNAATGVDNYGGHISNNTFEDSHLKLTDHFGGTAIAYGLLIEGNSFIATAANTQSSMIVSHAYSQWSGINIKNNSFVKAATAVQDYAINGDGFAGAKFGPGLQMKGNYFDGDWDVNSMAVWEATDGFAFTDNHFKNSTDYIMKLVNCEGVAYGNTFENCDLTKLVETSSGTDMCTETPDWAGNAGDVVQVLSSGMKGLWIYDADTGGTGAWGIGGDNTQIVDTVAGTTAGTKEVEIAVISQGIYRIGIKANISSYSEQFAGYLDYHSYTSDGGVTIYHRFKLDQQYITDGTNSMVDLFDVNIDIKSATTAYGGTPAKTINWVTTNGSPTHIKFVIGDATVGQAFGTVYIGITPIDATSPSSFM